MQILLDDELLAYWVQKDKELTDDVVLSATKRAVEASVEPEIAGVRVVFGPDGLCPLTNLLQNGNLWTQREDREALPGPFAATVSQNIF